MPRGGGHKSPITLDIAHKAFKACKPTIISRFDGICIGSCVIGSRRRQESSPIGIYQKSLAVGVILFPFR